MEKIEYTDQELEEMIEKAIESFPSVQEALDKKKNEDELIKESFDASFEVYNGVSRFRKDTVNMLKLSSIQLRLAKLLSILLNNGASEYIDLSYDKTKEIVSLIHEDDKIINEVKKSLKLLCSNGVIICNYDLSVLLALINEKTEVLVNILGDYLERYTNAAGGITYISNKNYESRVNELNDLINHQVLKLGLNK